MKAVIIAFLMLTMMGIGLWAVGTMLLTGQSWACGFVSGVVWCLMFSAVCIAMSKA